MGISDDFAHAAVRLCGIMARLAGWTPDIFWNATPAEADMVLGGWRAEDFGCGGEASAPPPDAALRARLMELFPDG